MQRWIELELVFAAGLLGLACAKNDPTDTTTGSTTEIATGTTPAIVTSGDTTAASVTSGGTSGGPMIPECGSDARACLDACANLLGRGPDCPWADIPCFGLCMSWLADADMTGCGAELRAVKQCEAGVSDFDGFLGCESTACGPEYLAHDLCRGFCGHLDGSPAGYNTGPGECSWEGSCYGGHWIEMVCPTNQDPTCSCRIDEAEVGTCKLGGPLTYDICDDMQVLEGCCNDLFLDVLDQGPPGVAPTCAEDPTGGDAGCLVPGLYVACTTEGGQGLAFCDDIGDTRQFGPCILEPECDIAAGQPCDRRCELIDGVPTSVPIPCNETSG